MADLLAEARGLKLGVVMANQYVAQPPEATRAAVLGTVGSQVVFRVERDDARLLEPRFKPTLDAHDLGNLGAYEVALRLLSAGNQVLPPTTGRTLPLPEPISDPDALREASRQRYGRDRRDVEAELAARLEPTARDGHEVGRRRRGDKR
ncbi:MAG: hypothetical protein ACRDYA_16190 [Egibacteraceae bacterium]